MTGPKLYSLPVNTNGRRVLLESDLNPDPRAQFRIWLDEATRAGEPLPSAMAVATSNGMGTPSVRMLLLEDVDERGFLFHTHLDSPKVHDLQVRPYVAATFHWPLLVRSVRVSGYVELLTRGEVARYFALVPTGIQGMLRACHQSQVIPDRETLEHIVEQASDHVSTDVPLHWGGFRILPDWIEFWQGHDDWLQDRLRYTRSLENWKIERLVP